MFTFCPIICSVVTCRPHSVEQIEQNNHQHDYVAFCSWNMKWRISKSTIFFEFKVKERPYMSRYVLVMEHNGFLVNAISSTTQGWFLPAWKQHFLSMLQFRRVCESLHTLIAHTIRLYIIILWLYSCLSSFMQNVCVTRLPLLCEVPHVYLQPHLLG